MSIPNRMFAAIMAASFVAACAGRPREESVAPVSQRAPHPADVRVGLPTSATVNDVPNPAASAPATPKTQHLEPDRIAERAEATARVLKEVEAYYWRLLDCYDRAREHDGALVGRVTVRFTVAPSGDVVDISDAGSTIRDKAMIACVQGNLSIMRLAPWEGKSVTVVLPIDFVPPG